MKIEDCIHCNSCASKCPYGLDTPSLLQRNLEDYKDVILPVRHWLCLAYCHQQNKHFFEEVIHFDTTKHTYHYLQGFYARLGGNYSKAQKELKIAVGDYLVNPRRAVAKSAHELVLAYTLDGKYGDAIDLARQNYYLERTNPYHIEAFHGFSPAAKSGVVPVFDPTLPELT